MNTEERRKARHVLAGPPPHVGTCTHCGEALDLTPPMRIDVFVAILNAFIKGHRACPIPAGATTGATTGAPDAVQ